LTAMLEDDEHSLGEMTCTWQTFLQHNDHTHPEPANPNCTSSTTLSPTGCGGAEVFFYRITLSVCDAAGLCTQEEVSVLPDCPSLVVTTFDTVPSGLPLSVDGVTRTTPFLLNFFEGEQHALSAPTSQCLPPNDRTFSSWSDSGSAAHMITVTTATTSYVATYADSGVPCEGLAFLQGVAPDHDLVMEAENFHRDSPSSDASNAVWTPVADPVGFVDEGAMYILPNPSGPWKTVGFSQITPILEFDFVATKTGLHNFWVRGQASTTGTNSVHLGLNGIEPDLNDKVDFSIGPSWLWHGPRQLNIASLGPHTFFVYGREKATRVDRIWGTSNLGVTPSGPGPVESARDNGIPPDQVPTAHDDSFTVDEDVIDEPLDVLQNDEDPETGIPGTLVVSAIGSPDKNGTAVADGSNTGILYTPAADFVGTEVFDYTILDEAGGTHSATVTVTVDDANDDPPDAMDDDFDAVINTPANELDVLANDTDPDPADSQLIISVTQPVEGFVSIRGDGLALLFDAGPTDDIQTFDYTLEDSTGLTDTATVIVTVSEPPNIPPTAQNDSFTVDEDVIETPLDVLQNDDDPETGTPGTLMISAIGTPDKNGTAVPDPGGTGILYTPAADFVGMETFTYTALDEKGDSDGATVIVTVENANNDPPDAVDDAFMAQGDSVDTELDVLLNDTDPDPAESQLIISVTQPAEGFVSIRGDGLALLFDAGPTDDIQTFDYTLEDSTGLTDTATVTVTVQGLPTGIGFQQDTGVDGDLVMEAEHFHRSSPSTDGDNAQWTEVADPAGFIAEGAMYVLPDPSGPWKRVGFSQVAPVLEFDFVATWTGIHNVWVRGQSLSTAKNSVHVGLDGAEPQLNDKISFSTGPNWVWGDLRQINITTTGQHTLELYPRERATRVDRIWVTKNLGTNPPDSDSGPSESPGGGGAPGNLRPTAADDSFSINEDIANFPLDVLVNDEDPETGIPGTLTIFSVGTPDQGGQALINGTDDGLLYTPALDFVGTETFTYTVLDELGDTDTATVSVQVQNFNDDPPVAMNDAFDAAVDSLDTDLDVLFNDSDPDPGDSRTIVSVTQPSNGFVEIAPDSLSLLFDAGSSESTESFTYTIEDSAGLDDTATVIVTVSDTPAGTGFQQDPSTDGTVVFEVEHFHRATAASGGSGAAWQAIAAPAGFVAAGGMYVLPDPSGPWKTLGFSQIAPILEIDFVATHTGLHNVWVRGQSLSTAKNSIHIGLDGVEPPLGLKVQFSTGPNWVWGDLRQINISTLGQHTLYLYARERATRIDRVWMTSNLGIVPSNGDSGPNESPETP